MDNIFIKNLRIIRKKLGLTQDEFAKPLGIKGTSVSAMERGASKPSKSVIELIEIKYRINKNWLLNDEGEIFRKESDNTNTYKEEGEDPEISELIKMTQEILKSDTDYALNLSANIKSFHKSVQLENEVHALKNRVSKIEGKLSASADKITKEDLREGKTKL